MRICVAAVLVLASVGGPAAATEQELGPVRPSLPPVPSRASSGTTPVQALPSDPALEAERRQAEARLKRREDQARRTLRSICRGC